MSNEVVEIDGSFGSGGGQMLRSAISLSLISEKPCRIFNIRKKRPEPGLALQHLLGAQALAQFCNGRLEGDFLGSQEICFYPGKNYQNRLTVNIPTAASLTLILQTLLPAALFAPLPVEININGGATDTFFSPTLDYFRLVFLKTLKKIIPHENTFGSIEIKTIKRGYYPEGGARIQVKVFPIKRVGFLGDKAKGFFRQNFEGKLKPFRLIERGPFKKILIISGAADTLKEKKVAERQISGAREILGKLKLPTEEIVEYYNVQCTGSQICLIAQFENAVIGTDNLGRVGKRAEDVGKEAALELLEEQKSGACFDKYLADQMLSYLALIFREFQISVSKITDHSKTNIWVIEKFLSGKFETKENIIKWISNKRIPNQE